MTTKAEDEAWTLLAEIVSTMPTDAEITDDTLVEAALKLHPDLTERQALLLGYAVGQMRRATPR